MLALALVASSMFVVSTAPTPNGPGVTIGAPAEAGHQWHRSGCDLRVWWSPADYGGSFHWWHDWWPWDFGGYTTVHATHRPRPDTAIGDRWAAMGWECGRYGLPIGEQEYWGQGWYVQEFNCGIMWINTWQVNWAEDHWRQCLLPRQGYV